MEREEIAARPTHLTYPVQLVDVTRHSATFGYHGQPRVYAGEFTDEINRIRERPHPLTLFPNPSSTIARCDAG